MTTAIDSALTNLVLLAFGTVGLWRGWRQLGRARASAAWPRTTGRVIAARLDAAPADEDGYVARRAVVTYHYEVDGAALRGARVFFGDEIPLQFAGPGKRCLAEYRAGRAVQVAYDPAAPGQAVLEPGVGAAAYLACAVPAAVALLGALGLVAGR
jgi:hypothetical protein